MTPLRVQRMRYALVGAMLFGDMLRFDHFSTSVVFGPDYIGRGKALGDSSAEKHTSVVHHVPQMDEDDLLVVTNMKSMLVHDRKGRIYDFGSVCACLRRTWEQTGTHVGSTRWRQRTAAGSVFRRSCSASDWDTRALGGAYVLYQSPMCGVVP